MNQLLRPPLLKYTYTEKKIHMLNKKKKNNNNKKKQYHPPSQERMEPYNAPDGSPHDNSQ